MRGGSLHSGRVLLPSGPIGLRCSLSGAILVRPGSDRLYSHGYLRLGLRWHRCLQSIPKGSYDVPTIEGAMKSQN